MLSNLPPGVTPSMLPGNSREDVARDRFREEVEDRMAIEWMDHEIDDFCDRYFVDYAEGEPLGNLIEIYWEFLLEE